MLGLGVNSVGADPPVLFRNGTMGSQTQFGGVRLSCLCVEEQFHGAVVVF